ncbi:MAG: hypothetical protein ACYC6G_02785 [Desulfobaccales bacterium]
MMMLDGKKTYITAAVLGLASFALAMGWIDKEQYQVIVGLLGSLGLAALRSGVDKSTVDKAKKVGPEETVIVAGALPVASGNIGANG